MANYEIDTELTSDQKADLALEILTHGTGNINLTDADYGNLSETAQGYLTSTTDDIALTADEA